MDKQVVGLCLAAGLLAVSTAGMAQDAAESPINQMYLGLGLTSLQLDNRRVPGVPTSSPGHGSRMAGLMLGYRISPDWSAELQLATDVSSQVGTDWATVGAHRYLGSSMVRPFLGGGLGHVSIDEAIDGSTQQVYGTFGVSAQLNHALELRLGYQRHLSFSDSPLIDNAYSGSVAWHFGAAPTAVSVEPPPVALAESAAPAEPAADEPAMPVLEPIQLRVQFDLDSAEIRSVYAPQFAEIAQVFVQHPEVTAIIEGHTCWLGSEAYNLDLSERRAQSVLDRFVDEYGIERERLVIQGFGESVPVADNTTEEGRQANRRVIVRIQP